MIGVTLSPLGSISFLIVKKAAYKCLHGSLTGQEQERVTNELVSIDILKEYSFGP